MTFVFNFSSLCQPWLGTFWVRLESEDPGRGIYLFCKIYVKSFKILAKECIILIYSCKILANDWFLSKFLQIIDMQDSCKKCIPWKIFQEMCWFAEILQGLTYLARVFEEMLFCSTGVYQRSFFITECYTWGWQILLSNQRGDDKYRKKIIQSTHEFFLH